MQVRKALVTGGAGFVGSHLVERLLADGAEVVVADDLSNGSEANIPPDATLERLDVREPAPLAALVERLKPDAVFHLAAQSSVTVSVKDPQLDLAINVGGTLNVVDAAKLVQAPVIYTSTGGALYGDEAPIPTPEDFPPAPLAPYGASKWAGEAYVRTWSVAGGVPHAICRLGNVYGPRQSPHGEAGVVAIFSHRLWSGERPVLYGEGEATRDYVYAGDVAEALIRAAGVAGAFNVATGTEVPVREVFERLRDVAGVDVNPELAPLRAGELARSGLDSGLAERELGWKAETPLGRGLEMTYRALVSEFKAG